MNTKKTTTIFTIISLCFSSYASAGSLKLIQPITDDLKVNNVELSSNPALSRTGKILISKTLFEQLPQKFQANGNQKKSQSNETLDLSFFTDKSFKVELTKHRKLNTQNQSYFGHEIGEEFSNVNIIDSRKVYVININDYAENKLYEAVIDKKSGIGTVKEFDLSKDQGKCGVDDRLKSFSPIKNVMSKSDSTNKSQPPTASIFEGLSPAQKVDIDIMVVYDTTAISWLNDNSSYNGDTSVFAIAMQEQLNQLMDGNNINVEFHVSHTMKSNYTMQDATSGAKMSETLSALAGSPLQKFKNIRNKREQYAADMVVYLADTQSGKPGGGYVSGIAFLLESNRGMKSSTFSVNQIKNALSLTVMHEITHNLGAGHARNQTQPGPGGYANYAAGFHYRGNNQVKYNTIMAYYYDNDNNRYRTSPYYSSPHTAYKGTTVGTSTADNRRVVIETSGIVSDYYDSILDTPNIPFLDSFE